MNFVEEITGFDLVRFFVRLTQIIGQFDSLPFSF